MLGFLGLRTGRPWNLVLAQGCWCGYSPWDVSLTRRTSLYFYFNLPVSPSSSSSKSPSSNPISCFCHAAHSLHDGFSVFRALKSIFHWVNQEQISRLLTGTPSSLSLLMSAVSFCSNGPHGANWQASAFAKRCWPTPPSSRRRQNSSWGQSLAPLNTGKNHNVYTFPLSLDSCRCHCFCCYW